MKQVLIFFVSFCSLHSMELKSLKPGLPANINDFHVKQISRYKPLPIKTRLECYQMLLVDRLTDTNKDRLRRRRDHLENYLRVSLGIDAAIPERLKGKKNAEQKLKQAKVDMQNSIRKELHQLSLLRLDE